MTNYSKVRSLGIVLLAHAVSAISVASTPAPYTASSPSNDYASPTTVEPATPDYNNKYNNYPPPQYPYSKQQAYDPNMYNNPPTNHLAESFTPYSSLLSPRAPFLFHRLPSLFGAPVHPAPVHPETAAYPSYTPPSYPPHSGFVPSQPIYEPQYPFAYPNKYPKNAYAVPSCDYQLLQPYRSSRPFLFYPQKPENLYDFPSSLPTVPSKPYDPQYRYQPATPPTYGSNYANNLPVYH